MVVEVRKVFHLFKYLAILSGNTQWLFKYLATNLYGCVGPEPSQQFVFPARPISVVLFCCFNR